MLCSLITGPTSVEPAHRREQPLAEAVVRPRRRRRSGSPRRSAGRRSRRPTRASTRPRGRGRRRRRRRGRSCRPSPSPSSQAAGRPPRAIGRPVAAEPVNADEVDARDRSTSGIPASGAESLEDVQHTGRQARLEAEAAEPPGRDRRMLRRLQHRAVPAEDRGERLPRDVRQRRVERDQQRGDPDRTTKREHGAVRHATPSSCGRTSAAPRRRRRAHLDCGVGLAARERRAACPSRQRPARSPPRAARAGARRSHARRSRARPACARPSQAAPHAPPRRRRPRPRHPSARRGRGASPSAGRVLSSQAPLAGGRSSPATRFGTSAGITRPTSRRRRRGSRR